MSPVYETERLKILDMLEAGAISAEDAVHLLNALSGESSETADLPGGPIPGDLSAEGEKVSASDTGMPPEDFLAQRSAFRYWWRYPLAAGAIVIILAGLLMYQGYQTAGYGFWFYCSWAPLLLGLMITALALYSRTARWLLVRIRDDSSGEQKRVAVNFPLPIRPAAWFIRTFGSWIPKLEKTSLDELILALEDNTTPERPFFVEIQGDEAEERVQVYIG
jgi:hypothetical protein